MPPAIRIEGLNELRRELRRIKDHELNDQLKKTNKRLADQVIAMAEPRVPVKTGALKRSLRGLGNQSGAVGKVGSASVPYAAVIHWGSQKRGIPRRAFLYDAAQLLGQTVADEYQRDIDRIFDAIRP